MRSIAGQCAGCGVEGGKSAAGIVFQGVETSIDCKGQARVQETVAELHAFVIKRADIAERCILVDTVHAQTQAAFAADKPAARKIVVHIGKPAASGVTAVKARKIAVSV